MKKNSMCNVCLIIGTNILAEIENMHFQCRTPLAHWTYFMQILSNYNTKSLYHIENSVIEALKRDISTFYTCEINKGDIWLQFEKLKKIHQMVLSYRNIKNKY